MRRLIVVNVDIMIRTLALLLLFAWFARAGARLGTVPLAANHVLMQFVGISAFVLDGFAFTAEHRVGVAVGARSRPALLRAIRLTGEFSLIGGAAFAILFAICGPLFAEAVSRDPAVRMQAIAMLPTAAPAPVLALPAARVFFVFPSVTNVAAMRAIRGGDRASVSQFHHWTGTTRP